MNTSNLVRKKVPIKQQKTNNQQDPTLFNQFPYCTCSALHLLIIVYNKPKNYQSFHISNVKHSACTRKGCIKSQAKMAEPFSEIIPIVWMFLSGSILLYIL